MLRFFGYTILGIFCLLLTAGTFLYIAVPVDFVRDRVVSEVKKRTGRDLIIAGGTSMSFYPTLGVQLEDVTLSAPADMPGAPLLTTDALRIKMPIMALLNRRVEIETFILDRPVITLRRDGEGRESWSFAGLDAPTNPSRPGVRYAAATGASANDALAPELQNFIDNSGSNAASGELAIAALKLGDVKITDGTVRYRDAAAGVSEELTKIDLDIRLEALNAPLKAIGSATWRGRAIPVRGELATPADLLANRPAKLKARVDAQDLALAFDGEMQSAGQIGVKGLFKFQSGNLPAVLSWAAGPGSSAGPLKTVSIQGTLSATPARVRLKKSKFALNGLTGSGDMGVDLDRSRPRLTGRIALGTVDLDSFTSAAPGNEKRTAPGGRESPDDPIGGLLSGGSDGNSGSNSGSQRPRGQSLWSREAIDVSALRAVDADLRVAFAGGLQAGGIKLERGNFALRLDGGNLVVRSDQLALYGGSGTIDLTLNARGSIPSYDVNFRINRVNALPLLKAAADFDWISGATDMTASLTGRGLSQRQMVKTMGGTAEVVFADGAIEGINIARVLRGIKQGQLGGFERSPSQKTDFSKLSASFRIAEGVAHNTDLSMIAPLARVTGKGRIDLGGERINYLAIPKLVSSLEGQGGTDAAGLTVPLRIEGPLTNPAVYPDLENLLKDPNSVVNALEGLVKSGGGKSGDVRGLVEGLLGKRKKGGDDAASDFLGNLFNQ